jgi:hypothetical protein
MHIPLNQAGRITTPAIGRKREEQTCAGKTRTELAVAIFDGLKSAHVDADSTQLLQMAKAARKAANESFINAPSETAEVAIDKLTAALSLLTATLSSRLRGILWAIAAVGVIGLIVILRR